MPCSRIGVAVIPGSLHGRIRPTHSPCVQQLFMLLGHTKAGTDRATKSFRSKAKPSAGIGTSLYLGQGPAALTAIGIDLDGTDMSVVLEVFTTLAGSFATSLSSPARG